MARMPEPNREVIKALIASVGLDPANVREWPEITARPDGHFLEYVDADGREAALYVTPAWVIEYRRALHYPTSSVEPQRLGIIVEVMGKRSEPIWIDKPDGPTPHPITASRRSRRSRRATDDEARLARGRAIREEALPFLMVGKYAECITNQGQVHARGRVIGYSIGPVFTIVTDTGERVDWREHLVREIPEPPKGRPVSDNPQA